MTSNLIFQSDLPIPIHPKKQKNIEHKCIADMQALRYMHMYLSHTIPGNTVALERHIANNLLGLGGKSDNNKNNGHCHMRNCTFLEKKLQQKVSKIYKYSKVYKKIFSVGLHPKPTKSDIAIWSSNEFINMVILHTKTI